MKHKKTPTALFVLGALIISLGVFLWQSELLGQNDKGFSNTSEGKQALGLAPSLVSVVLPEMLSNKALQGKRYFENSCQACHGVNAAGQEGVAPPLIHKIYEPSHHGDASFYRAVQSGVGSHHWRFGNMPPITGVTKQQVGSIIHYIRELQRANGIQ